MDQIHCLIIDTSTNFIKVGSKYLLSLNACVFRSLFSALSLLPLPKKQRSCSYKMMYIATFIYCDHNVQRYRKRRKNKISIGRYKYHRKHYTSIHFITYVSTFISNLINI